MLGGNLLDALPLYAVVPAAGMAWLDAGPDGPDPDPDPDPDASMFANPNISVKNTKNGMATSIHATVL
jgi:hypothetical protein